MSYQLRALFDETNNLTGIDTWWMTPQNAPSCRLEERLRLRTVEGIPLLPSGQRYVEEGQNTVKELTFSTKWGFLTLRRSVQVHDSLPCLEVGLSLRYQGFEQEGVPVLVEWELSPESYYFILAAKKPSREMVSNQQARLVENVYICYSPLANVQTRFLYDGNNVNLSATQNVVIQREFGRGIHFTAIPDGLLEMTFRLFPVLNEFEPIGSSGVGFLLDPSILPPAIGAIAAVTRPYDSWGDYRTFSMERLISPLLWIHQDMPEEDRARIMETLLGSNVKYVITNVAVPESERCYLEGADVKLVPISKQGWEAVWHVQQLLSQTMEGYRATAHVLDVGSPTWPHCLVSAFYAWSKRHPFMVYHDKILDDIDTLVGGEQLVDCVQILGPKSEIPLDFDAELSRRYPDITVKRQDPTGHGDTDDLLLWPEAHSFVTREALSRSWVKQTLGQSQDFDVLQQAMGTSSPEDTFSENRLSDPPVLDLAAFKANLPPLTVIAVHNDSEWHNCVVAASYAKAKRAVFVPVREPPSWQGRQDLLNRTFEDLEGHNCSREDFLRELAKLRSALSFELSKMSVAMLAYLAKFMLLFPTDETPFLEPMSVSDRYGQVYPISAEILGRMAGADFYSLAINAARILNASLRTRSELHLCAVSTEPRFVDELKSILEEWNSEQYRSAHIQVFGTPAMRDQISSRLYQEWSDVKWSEVKKTIISQDVVHFNCHGTFHPSHGPTLELDKKISSEDVPILKTNPIVLISACYGGSGRTIRTSPGLASEFMDRGALAVLGFMWSVESSHVEEIAATFYRFLPTNSLAAAVLKARHDSPVDSSLAAAALVLYGDPTSVFMNVIPELNNAFYFKDISDRIWNFLHAPEDEQSLEPMKRTEDYAARASNSALNSLGVLLARNWDSLAADLLAFAIQQEGFMHEVRHAIHGIEQSHDLAIQELHLAEKVYTLGQHPKRFIVSGLAFQIEAWQHAKNGSFDLAIKYFGLAVEQFRSFCDEVERRYAPAFLLEKSFAYSAMLDNEAWLLTTRASLYSSAEQRKALLDKAADYFERSAMHHPAKVVRRELLKALSMFLRRYGFRYLNGNWSIIGLRDDLQKHLGKGDEPQ